MIEVTLHEWRDIAQDGDGRYRDKVYKVDAEFIGILQGEATDSILVLTQEGEVSHGGKIVAAFRRWNHVAVEGVVTEQPSADAVGDAGDASTTDVDE